MDIPTINSYTAWGKLEEVWLGDVYPASWYDHLDSKVRDCFYEITEKTQEDLSIIQRKLEEFNVIVRRPQYLDIDKFVNYRTGNLKKPSICPRDNYLVYGNAMMCCGARGLPWAEQFEQYKKDNKSIIIGQSTIDNFDIASTRINGANTVRAGKDLYIDLDVNVSSNEKLQSIKKDLAPLWPASRLHLLDSGGHIDSQIAIVKPGVLLTCDYYKDHAKTFPGWHNIQVSKPEFSKHTKYRTGPNFNGKWFVPNMVVPTEFNQYVVDHALEWIGDYTETYFEINALVVDEKNILMLGENESVARELEKYGVTTHFLPFRTRTFWDGGLHCLTLDIRRQDTAVDLFPERDQSVYDYLN